MPVTRRAGPSGIPMRYPCQDSTARQPRAAAVLRPGGRPPPWQSLPPWANLAGQTRPGGLVPRSRAIRHDGQTVPEKSLKARPHRPRDADIALAAGAAQSRRPASPPSSSRRQRRDFRLRPHRRSIVGHDARRSPPRCARRAFSQAIPSTSSPRPAKAESKAGVAMCSGSLLRVRPRSARESKSRLAVAGGLLSGLDTEA
jgi:hypothetical protein